MNRQILLVFLFIVAALLRFWRLGDVPPSLNADEAAIGYNAYSILRTGMDEYGTRFPLAFRSFDDYKAPLYIYLTSASIAVFGMTGFAVRSVSALAGTLTVILTYFLVEKMHASTRLVGDPRRQKSEEEQSSIPFISALLLAVSPWHLHFSRSAYESNVAVFFIVLGLVLFFSGLRQRKHMVLAGIPFVLSMWTYHTPRIFVPLLVLSLAYIYRDVLRGILRDVIAGAFITAVLFLPMVSVLLSPEGFVRARGISSLQDPSILEQSVNWISDDNNSVVSRMSHNRRIEYARQILKGYLEHYNPVFLFMDKAEAKYRAPGMGLLYLWELPVIIIGLFEVLRRNQRWNRILVLWLILAPVAASPTLWLPHPIRTIVFLPAIQIVAAHGVLWIATWILRKRNREAYTYAIIFFGIAICSVFYYLHQYYVHLPIDYARDWQFGRKEVVAEVSKIEDQYDRVIISPTLDQPQVFFLFYLRYDPVKYLNEGGTVSGKFDAVENRFDKYYFRPVTEDIGADGGKTLYVSSPGETAEPVTVLKRIDYPDGETAFLLFEK